MSVKTKFCLAVNALKRKQKHLTLDEIKVWESYVENISKDTRDKSVLSRNKLVTICKSSVKHVKKNGKNRNFSQIASNLIGIDKKIHTKLKNGALRPERTLDLHGLTYDNAYSKVIKFINTGHQDGKRLLLVVTGKGKSHSKKENFFLESNRGVLKKAFPGWLQSSKLKHLILNVSQAHVFHGGEGAFYVYLRKNHYKT